MPDITAVVGQRGSVGRIPLGPGSPLTLAAELDTPCVTFLIRPPTLPYLISPVTPSETSFKSPMGLPRKSTEPRIRAAWLRSSCQSRRKEGRNKGKQHLVRVAGCPPKTWSEIYLVLNNTNSNFSVLFSGHTQQCLGLLLAAHLGITPGTAQKTI